MLRRHGSRQELEKLDYSISKHPEFCYKTEFQSHEPEFDYLKSLEIEEKISKIICAKLQMVHYFLSTNGKTIKFWKVQEKKQKKVSKMNVDSSQASANGNIPSSCSASSRPCLSNDVSKNPELLKKLALMLEDGDDFDCPVCLSPPTKTIITCCAHIFCQICILKTLKTLKPCCPICRQPLSETDLFLAPAPKVSDENPTTDFSGLPISSKVLALLNLLLESKKQKESTKSVVFSQFRKMLILLEEVLRSAGFVTLRLDGSMSMKKRAEVIQEFSSNQPNAPTVLLASLKAAGAGINLTVASRVYLVEPWWNPAAEEQAMDRVHRIGQKEEVKVVRLIVKDSIEERILAIQERKKKLAGGLFGQKASKEQKKMQVEDIRTMLRL